MREESKYFRIERSFSGNMMHMHRTGFTALRVAMEDSNVLK